MTQSTTSVLGWAAGQSNPGVDLCREGNGLI